MNSLKPILLIEDNKGIYLPQYFTKKYDSFQYYKNYDIVYDDLKYLQKENHINNIFYWESWQNILKNAKFVIKKNVYDLYQDKHELWAIPEEFDNNL